MSGINLLAAIAVVFATLTLVLVVVAVIRAYNESRSATKKVGGETDVSAERQVGDQDDCPLASEPLGPQCPHPKFEDRCTCLVKGKEMKITSKGPCKDCLEAYLDKYSTICASCAEPILPGEPVAVAWVGAPQKYTHMYAGCCECGGFYCGVWGEGEMIPMFPAGMSMMDLAAATGKPVVGNMDDDGNMRIEILDSPDESKDGK